MHLHHRASLPDSRPRCWPRRTARRLLRRAIWTEPGFARTRTGKSSRSGAVIYLCTSSESRGTVVCENSAFSGTVTSRVAIFAPIWNRVVFDGFPEPGMVSRNLPLRKTCVRRRQRWRGAIRGQLNWAGRLRGWGWNNTGEFRFVIEHFLYTVLIASCAASCATSCAFFLLRPINFSISFSGTRSSTFHHKTRVS